LGRIGQGNRKVIALGLFIISGAGVSPAQRRTLAGGAGNSARWRASRPPPAAPQTESVDFALALVSVDLSCVSFVSFLVKNRSGVRFCPILSDLVTRRRAVSARKLGVREFPADLIPIRV
jgi:hypothetical protein